MDTHQNLADMQILALNFISISSLFTSFKLEILQSERLMFLANQAQVELKLVFSVTHITVHFLYS